MNLEEVIKKVMWFPKTARIFMLVFLPVWVIAFTITLIYNFNVFAFIFFLFYTIFFCFLTYWMFTMKLVICKEYIFYQNFKKHIFEYNMIESIEVDDRGYISLLYDGKKYLLLGYMCWLTGTPNDDKNKELVEIITKNIKKKKKW